MISDALREWINGFSAESLVIATDINREANGNLRILSKDSVEGLTLSDLKSVIMQAIQVVVLFSRLFRFGRGISPIASRGGGSRTAGRARCNDRMG